MAEHDRYRQKSRDVEIKRLRRVIERDRSAVARVIEAINRELAGREWVREGRGPYEWDDDRYREEFGEALKGIRRAMEPLREVAQDMSDSPTDTEEVRAARSSLRSDGRIVR